MNAEDTNERSAEASIFTDIGPRIIELVKRSLESNAVAVQKTKSGDFATQIDLDVENLIVSTIKERFPEDEILAEEGFGDGAIGEERVWVIDPICGTNNLGRRISNYCSNIALVEGGESVAACVVDFAEQCFYWSVGDSKLYIGTELYEPKKLVPGTVVEVDFGATYTASMPILDRHRAAIRYLQEHCDCNFVSLNTSLSILYVALHKIDAAMVMRTNPWDAAAGVFLASQTGGSTKTIDGEDWRPSNDGYVVSTEENLQAQIILALKGG